MRSKRRAYNAVTMYSDNEHITILKTGRNGRAYGKSAPNNNVFRNHTTIVLVFLLFYFCVIWIQND